MIAASEQRIVLFSGEPTDLEVGVAVGVAVLVEVGVKVGVAVSVGVWVGVKVGVTVGVVVDVGVAVGVGGNTWSQPDKTRPITTRPRMKIQPR